MTTLAIWIFLAPVALLILALVWRDLAKNSSLLVNRMSSGSKAAEDISPNRAMS